MPPPPLVWRGLWPAGRGILPRLLPTVRRGIQESKDISQEFRAPRGGEVRAKHLVPIAQEYAEAVVLAVGAVAGGTLWYVRRKSRRAASDAELWAEATDPITRFGDA